MTRAANLAKIVTDANLEGTVDVAGAFTSLGIDDNADATAITIDSSENVMINTTNTNPAEANVVGVSLMATNAISASDDGNAPIQLNRKSDNGSIAIFRKDGTGVGQIGVNSNDQFYMSRSTGEQGFKFKNSGLIPANTNGSDSDNDQDLGISSVRWKDLYLSGNVYIGGTGSSNAFDDYEEGTFETTVGPSTSGTVTLTSSENTLSYTKIGRKVSILGAISVNAVSSPVGTFVSINNLPFTIGDLTELAGRGSASITFNDNTVSGSDSFEAEGSLLIEGESRIRVYRDASTVAGGDHFYISATYFTS
jgi:hypothetical protein